MVAGVELRREIPLFPLGAVLLCGGKLPLRIFEPRYLDLVGRCLKTDTGFGVVLIRAGRETRGAGGPPSIFVDYEDARSVGWRLAELLPLTPETKQSLLQMQASRERLLELRRLVAKLRG